MLLLLTICTAVWPWTRMCGPPCSVMHCTFHFKILVSAFCSTSAHAAQSRSAHVFYDIVYLL